MRNVTRLLAGMLIALATMVAPATAGTDHYWYHAKGTRCVAVKNPGGFSLIAARTTFVMHVDYDPQWQKVTHNGPHFGVQSFRLEARLVHPGHRLNPQSPWHKVAQNLTVLNGPQTSKLTVQTDSYDAEQDWRVEVKLVWDRTSLRDWVRKLSFPFTAPCPPSVYEPGGAGPS